MKATRAVKVVGMVMTAVAILTFLAGFLFGKTYVELDMSPY